MQETYSTLSSMQEKMLDISENSAKGKQDCSYVYSATLGFSA